VLPRIDLTDGTTVANDEDGDATKLQIIFDLPNAVSDELER